MNFGRVPLPNSKRALLQADGAPFAVGRDGNLYWAKGNLEIARLSPAGKVTLLELIITPSPLVPRFSV